MPVGSVFVAAGLTMALPDGRVMGFDDVGEPNGTPVLYVHGTPDSRRARHPDDTIAERSGLRLVAVDRPGAGLSTFDPSLTLGSFADDAVALADHLGVARWRVLGWSAGGPFALALAGHRRSRASHRSQPLVRDPPRPQSPLTDQSAAPSNLSGYVPAGATKPDRNRSALELVAVPHR